jgi:uncharacterized protein (TIGR03435 family)
LSHGLLLGVIAILVFITPGLAAQSASAPPPVTADTKLPVFDVISIKPNKTGSGSMNVNWNDTNFDASNISLKMMLLNAYDLKESQLVDLPKWDNSARFDIHAKVVDPDLKGAKALTEAQNRAMVQPILADRFQLKFHFETKVLQVYELVIAKDGPKFTDSKITGDQKAANGMGAGSMTTNNTSMTSTAVPMSALITLLSSQLQRVVVDKTGLTDKYDLNLTWSRDDGSTPASDSTSPSIFTALQEQLGLHLQPSKSPVEVFVIDHVELPSEN